MEQFDSKLEELLIELLTERLNVEEPDKAEAKRLDDIITKLSKVRNEALKLDTDYAVKEEERKLDREKIALDREKFESSCDKEREKLELEKRKLELEIEIAKAKMELEAKRFGLDEANSLAERNKSWWSKWGPTLAGAGITVAGGIATGFLNMLAEERTVDKILDYEEENTITTKAGNYAGKFRPFGRK